MSGTLSAEAFALGGRALARLSQERRWECALRWVDCAAPQAADLGGGYLDLSRTIIPQGQQQPRAQAQSDPRGDAPSEAASRGERAPECKPKAAAAAETAEEEAEEEVEEVGEGSRDDPAALPTSQGPGHGGSPAARHLYTYHAVYSLSYAVPLLLLRGQAPGGQLLSWQQTAADLPPASQALLAEGGAAQWTFLGPQEHPLLGGPWVGLHPCGTAACMALLLTPQPAAASEAPPAEGQGNTLLSQGSREMEAGATAGGEELPREAAGASSAPSSAAGEGAPRVEEDVTRLDRAELACSKSKGRAQQEAAALRYMLAWWNLVAPVVGLPVSPQEFQEGRRIGYCTSC